MCVCVFFILFYLKNKLIAKHTHIFLITLLPNEERKWCDLAVFFLGLLKLYLPKLMRKQERKWRNGFWTKLAQQLATFSCLFFFFFFAFFSFQMSIYYLFIYFCIFCIYFFYSSFAFFFLFYIIIFLSLFLSFYIFYVLVLILYFLKRFYFIYFLRKKFWVFELFVLHKKKNDLN